MMNRYANYNLKPYLIMLTIGFLLLFQIVPVGSRIYIDIDSAMQKKIPIAIPAFRHEAGDHPMGIKMAEILSNALGFSGLFQIVDPAVFLQDPQKMGVEPEEIKFAEWTFLGADLLVRGSYRTEGNRIEAVIRLYDVIHQKLLLNKEYKVAAEATRRTVLGFADEMMLYLTGEPGIFRTKIAFVGDATGHKEVYLADFDGSNIRQLTRDQSINLAPAWSGSGGRISFVGYRQGNPDLYLMDLISESVNRISHRPGLNIAPAWHPRDEKLAATLSFTGNPELYLLDERGEILRQLTVNWSIDVSPSWSPDGKQLAYVSNRAGKPQIYVLDIGTRRSRRLTFEGEYNTSPAWSPRGDRIVYSSMHNGIFDLFLISPDGRELSQLTGGNGNNENPCWSADGRLILFQSDRRGANTLWVMLANGADQRRLQLNLGGTHTEPAWSERLTQMVP